MRAFQVMGVPGLRPAEMPRNEDDKERNGTEAVDPISQLSLDSSNCIVRQREPDQSAEMSQGKRERFQACAIEYSEKPLPL
jgi:hypothetical protein